VTDYQTVSQSNTALQVVDIFEQRGVSQDDMKRTLAILIFQTVTGEAW